MLAARRSFGNLRATARAAQTAPSLPASPARSLVSAVLLSSDRAKYEKRTVKQLQEELGERGLSTRGKKAALVDRLFESVTRANLAEAGSRSSSFSTTSAAQATKARDAGAKQAGNDSSEASSVVAEEVPIHSPSPVTSETPVPTAGEDPEAVGVVTAAPGVVIEKEVAEQLEQAAEQAPGGGIDLPQSVFLPETRLEEQQEEIMIPMSPDKYRNPPDHDPFTQPFTMHPSWISLGDSKPVHHGLNAPVDDPQSHSSEPRAEFQYMPDTTFLEDVASNIGFKIRSKAKSAAKQASSKSEALLHTLEKQTGVVIPPLNQPVEGGKKQAEEKFELQDRDLTSEERTGAWGLGAIIGLGFLFGGLGKKSKSGDENREGKHDL